MKKPIVLVIMDGVGKGDGGSGDAVTVAKTPTLDNLLATCPHTYIKAHGTAVGLPSDEDMGNSEVGHNALGCGQVYSQGAKLVGESIENGTLFASATWKDLVENAKQGKETALNNANKYRSEQIPAAEAEVDRILQQAEAKKAGRVNEAAGQVARFNAMYAEYVKFPGITMQRMYYETMEELLPGLKVILTDENGNHLNMFSFDGNGKEAGVQ